MSGNPSDQETATTSPFERSSRKPWSRRTGLSNLLQHWRTDPKFQRQVTLWKSRAAREESTVPVSEDLHPDVIHALKHRGISRLYVHQAEALGHARAGRHVVIATPTASGKSLCYNVPVLDALARDRSSRAMYLFPTKALSRDQEQAFRGLLHDANLDAGAITYDGDTPADARRAARERSAVILTNPDMLHAGILPHHTLWARVFANLRYVVLDELHTYRGVFGSHLANVIRRLRRIARFHGSNPTFIFASATIGNPEEHAARMLGEQVALIDESGAPNGPRHVIAYNPPIVNAELGMRASYIKTTVRIVSDLVRAQVPTLVFGESRNAVEVMLKYLRDRLAKDRIDPESIQAYRGGYLPEHRRAIEAGLRNGDIRCAVATNALELGIDIGGLDAVVCAGYPGSISGLWQRFGRAGRRQDPSLALLVTSSTPLNQYIAVHADTLVGAPIEHARIDPNNVEILIQHLKCAAFELPFEDGDRFGDLASDSLEEALGFLADHQVLHATRRGAGQKVWHWSADSYPANHVSLRSVGWDNFVIVELGDNRTLAEMDWRSTHTMLHEQAIYQHGGEQYQVETLDFENHKAYVRRVEPDYYTQAMTHTKVAVLEEDEVSSAGGDGLSISFGDVSVIEKVVGYKKIKFHTHENVGYGDVHLPEMQMHTESAWFVVPESIVTTLPYARATVIDALRGLSKAMHIVATVGLMIDPRDLGRTIGDRSDADAPPARGAGGPGFDPTVFLYDRVPGGVGLSRRIFEQSDAVMLRARMLVEGCSCHDGCPACIGPEAGAVDEPVMLIHSSRRQVVRDLLDRLGFTRVQ